MERKLHCDVHTITAENKHTLPPFGSLDSFLSGSCGRSDPDLAIKGYSINSAALNECFQDGQSTVIGLLCASSADVTPLEESI